MSQPWYDQAFGRHYPLLYRHRDQAEASQAVRLLRDLVALAENLPVLDLGCGEGRHARPLALAGFTVIGVDLSWPLLRAAARQREKLTGLARGDMRHLPFRDDSLGTVLSLFTAFGYFGTLTENLPVMREVARVLQPGGLWCLDYMDCDAVKRELSEGANPPRKRQIDPLEVTETKSLGPGQKWVEKLVQLRPMAGKEAEAGNWGIPPQGLRYTEQVALFEREEMLALSSREGLQLVASAGSYSGASLGQGPRWIMVFRRNGREDTG